MNETMSDCLHSKVSENLLNKENENLIKGSEKLQQFSLFKKPISNILPFSTVSVVDVYNLIVGDEYRDITQRLRSIKDKNKAREFKASKFDYVCVSGVFSQRSNKSLIHHSGLMVIDFDCLECVESLRELLIVDKELETELLFKSPSGDGLKWVVRINLGIASHQEYFIGIQNYIKYTYGVDVDGSGKDVARACFLPNDKDVFINPKYIEHV